MKLGFIDYYLDEWHANNYPAMIEKASGGTMTVGCAYGMIDSPIGGMTTSEWCAKMNIPQCATIEEVIANSDALVVLSPDNCEMHETLCQLPLASGKPTYVDKTFAPDGEIARRIFAVAEAHNTPCCSSSALRFATEYHGIDIGSIRAIVSCGPNGFETYAIHQLEPIMMLMQTAPKRVLATATDGYTQLLIEFEDGRTASLSNFMHGSPFLMNICTNDGNLLLDAQSDYFGGFIRALVEFFRTSEAFVPHNETIAIMDLRGAGVKALAAPGTWIDIG